MSEKRFKVDSKVADDMYSYIFDNDIKLCLCDVVDLLNELAEENEQLKKELLRIKKTVSSIQKEINNYYNEVCSNE